LGDLLGGGVLVEELDDFPFAGGEPAVGGAPAGGGGGVEEVEEVGGEVAGDDRFAVGGEGDESCELVGVDVFVDVIASAVRAVRAVRAVSAVGWGRASGGGDCEAICVTVGTGKNTSVR
jgi:hypothetical protein